MAVALELVEPRIAVYRRLVLGAPVDSLRGAADDVTLERR